MNSDENNKKVQHLFSSLQRNSKNVFDTTYKL